MRSWLSCALLLAGGGFVSTAWAQYSGPFQDVYNYVLTDGPTVRGTLYGRVLKPTNYDPNQSYPIVVFYHGNGEKGTNNTSQVNGNINGLIAAAQARGFFVYAPQVDANAWYTSSVDQTMRELTTITHDFNIDTSRMYVTGLSMGGGGTWDSISRYKDVFAAAVTASGVQSTVGTASAANLAGKPVWMFHNADDTTVNVASSRDMLNAIRAADGGKVPITQWRLNSNPSQPYYSTGAPYYSSSSGTTYYQENNLRYTEYSSGGHNSWSKAYTDNNMYNWLLQQSTPLQTLQAGKKILMDFGYNTAVDKDSQGRTWNTTGWLTNSTLSATALPFVSDSTGTRTLVNVETVVGFGNNASGYTTDSMYDAGISGDAWSVGSSASPGKIIIHDLEPGATYSIALFGSRNGADGSFGTSTRYTIGTDFRDLNILNNTGNQAIFSSVLADALGNITITVGVTPGTNTRTAYLNALELTAVPEPASVCCWMLLGTSALLTRFRRSV